MGKINEQVKKITEHKQNTEISAMMEKIQKNNSGEDIKLSPEAQSNLQQLMRKQMFDKKRKEEGWEAVGELTEQDVAYFKKLIIKEQNYMRLITDYELKKYAVIEELKNLNKEQMQFEQQLHEKYNLPDNGEYKVDLNTNEVIKKVKDE